MVKAVHFKGYLQSMARAYSTVFQERDSPDFGGLREFYHTVQYINRPLKEKRQESRTRGRRWAARDSDDDDVRGNFQRHDFAGSRPAWGVSSRRSGFRSTGWRCRRSWRHLSVAIPLVNLIRQNLVELEARHLMLLTRKNAALTLLFDEQLLEHANTELIFGSGFPQDKINL